MRRIVFLWGLVLISILGFAQKPLKATNGLEVPEGKLKIGQTSITANGIEINNSLDGALFTSKEGNTLIGIDTTKTIKKQLDIKANISDVLMLDDTINPISEGLIYSADSVDQMTANPIFLAAKRLGFAGKSIPEFSYSLITGGLAMVSGNMYGCLHRFNKNDTISTVKFLLNTKGVYVADAAAYNGIIIYRLTSTQIVEVTRTTNNGNIWNPATATYIPVGIALATPITVEKGEYLAFVCAYNSTSQTTAPTISAFGTVNASNAVILNKPVAFYKNVANPLSSYNFSLLLGLNYLIGIWPE